MSVFEIVMLCCFGFAWPLSIYKSVKSKSTKGKSLLFLFVIVTGYVAGIFHKLMYNYDNVIFLYVLNGTMVSIDIVIYLKNRRVEKQSGV